MKKWLAAILSVLLIVQVVPVIATAAADDAAVIDRLYRGMLQQETSIDITRYKVSVSDFQRLYQRIIDTHPDLFFVESAGYSYFPATNQVTRVSPTYLYEHDEQTKKMAEYNAALDKIAAGVDPTWADWQIALYLHDYLVTYYEYDYTFESNTAYSFLTTGTGVCQAYAYTYMALLRRFDIPVDYASSETMHHGWNLVQIDGGWYHVDVTWDDCRTHGTVGHEYFLLSDDTIRTKSDTRPDIHTGWVASEQERVCDSKKYETALWQGIKTPFVPMDGKWYFIGPQGNTYAIKATDWNHTETVYDLTDHWMAKGQSAYWQGYYSGLGRYGDELVWNTPYTIMAIDPYSKDPRELFENWEDMDIYGLSVDGNIVIYSLRNNPNERESSGKAVEELLTLTLEPVARKIVEVVVAEPPDKTEYLAGEELDLTGLTLDVRYNDGEMVRVSDGYTYDAWTASTPGEHTITVSYEGFTTSFTVTVPRQLLGIKVYQPPFKTEYALSESLDPAGLIVALIYDDGVDYVEEGFDVDMWLANGYGAFEVGVRVENWSDTFTVTVPRHVKSAEIDVMPTKEIYLVGETPDMTGLELSVTYVDGETEIIDSGYTVGDWMAKSLGNSAIPVTIDGITLYVNVVVEPWQGDRQLAAVTLVTLPHKTQYEVGEALDTAGLELELLYSDGTTEITREGFEPPDWTASEAGISTVVVRFDAFRVSYDVTVIEPQPQGILGDVDDDQDVTAADALMALQAATGKIDLPAEKTRFANVDGDDSVTAADALMILQYATGKITGFTAQR